MGIGAIDRCRQEVARLADAALAARGGNAGLTRLMGSVQEAIERELGADGPVAAPACAAGCAACCTVNVATQAVEGLVAAAWLAARLDGPGRAARARELLAFHDRVRWLEDEDRIAAHEACPLLTEDGRCSIHPVRPLSCRSLSSLDPADCHRALEERVARDGGGEVRMNVLQHALYTDAVAELQAAAARAGLDARCRDVSGMIGIFLADPARVERYLAGERLPIE